ncbi:NUDIX hydrolase [Sinimarinibacterium flocculans]|uniref:NUDIX hydrolase n=1 Tax=Sinimarinibacterium flocculans TaxID=985250 RepID=UPI0024929E37|nr:NUDIX hydrolase [Sinimarinibacterium flocculans]
MANVPVPRFCSHCGGAMASRLLPQDHCERAVCSACGIVHYACPRLLVLTLVFAENRLLLIRRGQPPYPGSWAPPGGYVEAGESLEAAAVRELEEEVGLRLDRTQLLPHAMESLPELNQVVICFLALLDKRVSLHPAAPEALDAAWFAESEYPSQELWQPAAGFDISRVYERVSNGRFDFYQRTDDAMRVISDGTRVDYLWRRSR